MIIKNITSSSNPSFKELEKIRSHASDSSLVLIQGEDLVKLAKEGGKLDKVILLKEDPFYEEYPQFVLNESLYKKLSSYASLPKVMGVARLELSDSIEGEKILYLDGIQDPGNLGTIIRTALAFSYEEIILSKDCVSPFNFKAVAASKGACFHVRLAYKDLDEIKKAGYLLVMSDLKGGDIAKIEKPKGKFCMLIGNEGQGIRKENLSKADLRVFLPIDRKIDSLNAAIAAGILMYLWR